MIQNLLITSQLTKIYWQIMSQYRLGAIIWILNGFISPLVLMGVWILINNTQNLPVNNSQIVTYYLLSIIILRLTQSWTAESLGPKIKDGALSSYLVKPVSYWTNELARDLGIKMVRLISLSPFIIIFLILFKNLITIDLSIPTIALFVLAVIIGFTLNFFMQNIVGLLSLWLQDTFGANQFYSSINTLFSGRAIPLILMPATLQVLSIYLPFRFIVSFPIEILMGGLESQQLLTSFIMAFFWLVVTAFLWWIVYTKGIRNYTSVGI